ncbi:hypothetical protein TNCV_958241 [Trichonephila clavipes]|nr:hypothetical protein TNCV_958241 [Trichonephila clavipes]
MEGLPYCNLYRSKFGDKKIWRPKVGPPRIQPSGTRLVNRCCNTPNTSAADGLRCLPTMFPLLQIFLIMFVSLCLPSGPFRNRFKDRNFRKASVAKSPFW